MLFTSESGQTAQYTVALRTQPTANVHVAVSTMGGGGSLSTSGLDFTTSNWNTPQTVTITGLDNGTVGNEPFSVENIATSTDLNYNNVQSSQQFTNVDNESKNIYISPQTGLVTTRGGGTATFTVVLTQAPSANVVVNLVSNDPGVGTVSPASLTFLTSSGGGSGWNVPRTVTVTGQNDGAAGQSRDYAIIVTRVSADATYGDPTCSSCPTSTVTNVDAPPPVIGGTDGRLQRGRIGRPRDLQTAERPVVRAQPARRAVRRSRRRSGARRLQRRRHDRSRRLPAVDRPVVRAQSVHRPVRRSRRHPGSRRTTTATASTDSRSIGR